MKLPITIRQIYGVYKEILGDGQLIMEPVESFVPYTSKSVDNSIYIECTTTGELENSIKSMKMEKQEESRESW